MTQPVLEVSGLTKYYGPYPAVNDIDFTLEKGQIIGLLGPNGAGKSSTIQMLLGLLTPSGGKITYFNKDFKLHRLEILQKINYLSAFNSLLDQITVQENLNVFALTYNVHKPKRKIDELLDFFEVAHLRSQRYENLSSGQKTRVNLVKAFLNDPEIVLMDEPTASLDPDIVDKTLSMIEQFKKERNLSIIYTSHNMHEVERISDQVIIMSRGKIVKHAPTKELPNLHELFIQIARGEPER